MLYYNIAKHKNGVYLLLHTRPYCTPPSEVYSLLGSFIYTFDKCNIAKYRLPSLELQCIHHSPIDNSKINKILTTGNEIYVEILDNNKATVGWLQHYTNRLEWNILYEFHVSELYCIAIQSTTNKIALIYTNLIQSTQYSYLLHIHSFLFSKPYKEPLIIKSQRQFDFGVDLKCRVIILAGTNHIPSR
jgi:hypothetical protein